MVLGQMSTSQTVLKRSNSTVASHMHLFKCIISKKVPYTPIIKYVISRKARQEKDPKLFCAMNATIV